MFSISSLPWIVALWLYCSVLASCLEFCGQWNSYEPFGIPYFCKVFPHHASAKKAYNTCVVNNDAWGDDGSGYSCMTVSMFSYFQTATKNDLPLTPITFPGHRQCSCILSRLVMDTLTLRRPRLPPHLSRVAILPSRVEKHLGPEPARQLLDLPQLNAPHHPIRPVLRHPKLRCPLQHRRRHVRRP